MYLLRWIIWLLVVMAVACQSANETPAPTATFAPRFEIEGTFQVGQCVKVTRPTNLRFGPGVDYPVMINIPVRAQPNIHILELGIVGRTCQHPSQCNVQDEGWWWPVEVQWLDTGDIDKGWLWQGEFKSCSG